MRFRYSIAVAGTHGKTTTTSLVASILAEGGEDPTFVIGGRLKSAGSNARLGTGPLPGGRGRRERRLVHAPAAADRDRHQHRQRPSRRPTAATSSCSKQSFVDFLHNLPFYGLAVLCVDDAQVAQHPAARSAGRSSPTGSTRAPTCAARTCATRGSRPASTSSRPRAAVLPGDRSISPATHNVRNALAAIAVATELGIDDAAIAARAGAASRASTGACSMSRDVVTAVGRVTHRR